MKIILQVFYIIFSAVLLSLAIPNELYPFGFPLYAFIALIPYYFAIKNCKSYKSAFFTGFCQAIITHLLSSFWLAFFKDFAIFTLGGSAFGTGLFGGLGAIFLYLPFSRKNELIVFADRKPFYLNDSFRAVYFAAVYTLYEYVKSNGFLGYPWGTVSSTMYTFPIFTQIASLTGAYGVTFVTVLFNAITAQAIQSFYLSKKVNLKIQKNIIFQDHIISARFFMILFAVSLVYGIVEYNKVRKPVKQLTTITVQQNTDPWEQPYDEIKNIRISEKLSLEKAEELSKNNKKAQLVVWSEGTLISPFPDAKSMFTRVPEELPLTTYIREIDAPLITGGAYRHRMKSIFNEEDRLQRYFNSTLLYDSNGEYRGYYAKLHLVPFAELIPGIRKPFIKKIFRKIANISSGWDKGDALTYFDIPCTKLEDFSENPIKVIDINTKETRELTNNETKVRISTPICFDDAFTEVMRPLFLNGSELFINLSDDSWSLTKSSEIQHFVIASYRAIEFRTTLVRSTNAGFSCVIDPAGKILSSLPLFESCASAYDVPVYKRELTLYAKAGDWLCLSCLVFLLIIIYLMHKTFTKSDYIPSERKKRHYKLNNCQ